jgi:DNA-binding transcriptional ArsR family regulator
MNTTTTTTSMLDLDTVFEVLSDRRRRYALYALHRSEGGSMTVDRLAVRVGRLEDDGRTITAERRPDRIAEDLREHHVPKLVDAGAVEYDERSDMARYHGRPTLEEWLEHAEYREGYHPEC